MSAVSGGSGNYKMKKDTLSISMDIYMDITYRIAYYYNCFIENKVKLCSYIRRMKKVIVNKVKRLLSSLPRVLIFISSIIVRYFLTL
jgi:hypothetical protein